MRYRKAACRQASISMAALLFIACHSRETAPARFGFGRPATTREIDSMAIAIKPDGRGLPKGHGDPATGALLYKVRCAACHGATGSEGPFPKLVGALETPGARGSSDDPGKTKTIGNYWPYATTVFDYIRRAMPLDSPGSLNNDEVYSLTAWLLHANRIIDSNTVIDSATLPRITMPARNYYQWITKK